METKEYIEERIKQLKEAQIDLEHNLTIIRVLIGEFEAALDPASVLPQDELPEVINEEPVEVLEMPKDL